MSLLDSAWAALKAPFDYPSTELDYEALIREVMLAAYNKYCKPDPKLHSALMYAPDLDGLWYARIDLMTAISAKYGEWIAQEVIQAITEIFQEVDFPGAKPSSFATLN